MKHLKILLILIILVIVGCAAVPKIQHNPYTFDGPLDPAVLLDWLAVSKPWVDQDGNYRVRVENPDKRSSVKIVEVVAIDEIDSKYHAAVNHGFYILGYFYFDINIQRWRYFRLTPQSHYAVFYDG